MVFPWYYGRLIASLIEFEFTVKKIMVIFCLFIMSLYRGLYINAERGNKVQLLLSIHP